MFSKSAEPKEETSMTCCVLLQKNMRIWEDILFFFLSLNFFCLKECSPKFVHSCCGCFVALFCRFWLFKNKKSAWNYFFFFRNFRVYILLPSLLRRQLLPSLPTFVFSLHCLSRWFVRCPSFIRRATKKYFSTTDFNASDTISSQQHKY